MNCTEKEKEKEKKKEKFERSFVIGFCTCGSGWHSIFYSIRTRNS